MHLYLALISCLVCTAHCWQFDGGGSRSSDEATPGQRSLRLPRNTARALARGPPPGRGSAALLGSQQQDVLYACPLNSMCQCAGMPNETSTLIEINCNEVALYKFPGKRSCLGSPGCLRCRSCRCCCRNTYWSAPSGSTWLGCQYFQESGRQWADG